VQLYLHSPIRLRGIHRDHFTLPYAIQEEIGSLNLAKSTRTSVALGLSNKLQLINTVWDNLDYFRDQKNILPRAMEDMLLGRIILFCIKEDIRAQIWGNVLPHHTKKD
jgi:hypothetical protein